MATGFASEQDVGPGRILARVSSAISTFGIMTVSAPDGLSCLHVVCVISWSLAAVHRARRGPVIAWHSTRLWARAVGMFGAVLTGISLLHREPELFGVGLVKAQIVLALACLAVDHLIFNRAASRGLAWVTIAMSGLYVALGAA